MLNVIDIKNLDKYSDDEMVFHVNKIINEIERCGLNCDNNNIAQLLRDYDFISMNMSFKDKLFTFSLITRYVSDLYNLCQAFNTLYCDDDGHIQRTSTDKERILSAFKDIFEARVTLSVLVQIVDEKPLINPFSVTVLDYGYTAQDYVNEQILQKNYPDLFNPYISGYVNLGKLEQDTLIDLKINHHTYFITDIYENGFTYMIEF